MTAPREKRSHRVSVYVTETEYQLLASAAALVRRDIPDWGRLLLLLDSARLAMARQAATVAQPLPSVAPLPIPSPRADRVDLS